MARLICHFSWPFRFVHNPNETSKIDIRFKDTLTQPIQGSPDSRCASYHDAAPPELTRKSVVGATSLSLSQSERTEPR